MLRGVVYHLLWKSVCGEEKSDVSCRRAGDYGRVCALAAADERSRILKVRLVLRKVE